MKLRIERGYAETPSGQVHYRRRRGDIPLVLFGPSGRSSRVFLGSQGLFTLLPEVFDVIAPDILGAGASDPLPQDMDFPQLAETMLTVLGEVGVETALLFGMHAGNKLVSALAANHPDHVDGIILCGQSHSLVVSQEARNKSIGDKVRAGAYPSTRTPDEHLRAWTTLGQRAMTRWHDLEVENEARLSERIGAVQNAILDDLESYASLADLYRHNFTYDMSADWRRVTAPTLIVEIVTLREDILFGRQGTTIQQLIAGSVLVEISAKGYRPPIESFGDELVDVMTAFITRHIGEPP